MATKKSSDNSLIDSIFTQLISQHNSAVPNSAALGSELDSEITTWIDSGSLLLNMILSNKSDGGYPCGRITQIFGRESIGKSTLSYVAIANCQRMGGIPIYADIEHAANKTFMKMLGVDLDKMIWTDIQEVEDLFEVLEKNLTTIISSGAYKDKPILIIIDSVTALQTKMELETGYDFNMNVSMGKAKQLGKAFKKISPFLNKANASMICIDQIRDNTSGYGPGWTVPGGKALPFYSSIRLLLEGKEKVLAMDPEAENRFQVAMAEWKAAGGKKSGQEKPERDKSDKAVIGYEVAAYTIKNKTAPPDRKAHFRILFAEGLRDAECYLDYCIKFGFIKKGGAYNEIIAFPNECGKFYDSEWLNIISDVEIHDKIVELLIDRLTIKMKGGTYQTVTEEIEHSEEKDLIEKLKKEE